MILTIGSAVVAYCATWCLGLAFLLSRRPASDAVAISSNLLPPLVLLTCAIVFYLVPRGSTPPFVRWMHHIGFGGLFVFLTCGSALHLQATMQRARRASPADIAQTLRRWWCLTELMPAPSALLILVTGLRLIYDAPQTNSLREGWLFWLVNSFALFFWDGLLGYRSTVRDLHAAWEAGGAQPASRMSGREFILVVHAVSFPFILLIGAYKPDLPQPFSSQIVAGEEWLSGLPPGFPQVAIAVAVIVAVGLGVAALRRGKGIPSLSTARETNDARLP